MRFIDLALAALIGTSAITGIVAWNPEGGDTGTRRLETALQLRDRLVEFLQQDGMIQFESPAAACHALSGASNSTFRLYAVLGPDSCGSPPTGGSPSATLSFRLAQSEVELVAWSSA